MYKKNLLVNNWNKTGLLCKNKFQSSRNIFYIKKEVSPF